jgi:hypothetical protein
MSDTISAGTVYLVQRWHWRPHEYLNGQFRRDPDEGGLPVRAFRDPACAEAFCRAQELARRASANPFRYGWGVEGRSSLDEGRLRDWLLDAGLTPPGDEGEEAPELIRASWQAWWGRNRDSLSEQKRGAIARALTGALAGQQEVEDGAVGLDDRFARMDELTMQQRHDARMVLIGQTGNDYPAADGERDATAVETKWRRWWDDHCAAMTEYQRQMVWEALDRVRFFEVVALEGFGEPAC